MAIYFDKETKTFYLEGKSTTYAFFINNFGYAEHLYYGKKIHRDYLLFTRYGSTRSFVATLPGLDNRPGINSYSFMNPEISFFGTGDYREPTVHPRFETKDRLIQLHYHSYEILDEKPCISGMPSLDGEQTLVLHLYDEIKEFGADLYYTVYDDCDVIARRIVYINNSDSTVALERAYSFAMSLPSSDYDMISLFGGWACERQVERAALHHGVSSVDSKRATSSATLNPFIAIVDRDTTEKNGNAYGFNLVYSSSYVLKAERASGGEVIVSGGINDFDFEWKLEPGESFETPEIVIAYSSDGIGGMSREFHDAYREHLIPKKHVKSPRPILINNWEATYFNFTTEKICAIADAVEGTGIDTLVLDDAWFGKRNDDTSGLGDWYVNEKKLVGGLDAVINHVHAKGMKFGLWFEPEMISEDSEIFRAHPEYAIGAPDRKRCYSRHQFAMDLTNKEARDYIVDSVNAILKKHKIDYVKWDYNRNVTEFFSGVLEAERQSEFAHRYALGVYDLFDRIVNANPDILFEGCSGGGARFDPAVLAYFPQIWTSDNSDAEDRTRIQYGTSLCYPLSAMSCHVSAVPNHQVGRSTKFDTRGDIAHLGATGYELDTTVFTDENRAQVKAQIQKYKGMEELVLTGDLYRLDDPFNSNYFAFAIVSKDKSTAHLTCYRSLLHCNDHSHRVIMQGLDEKKEYYIPELNIIVHGSTLMSVGIPVPFAKGDFQTKTYTFEEK
ncbi:MAG: alpha-galactosidase [Ruminococcaceae bacterium]|nr:alpha-galactosidase [Oscillospiraceae bacterium]